MSKKSKTTTKPWEKAQPYILGAASDLQNIYQGQQGNVADIAGQVQGLVPGLVDKFNQGNAGVTAAGGYVTDVLGGKYLSGNPYLEDIIGTTKANVANDVLSQYSAAGRYGSGAMAGTLADKLSSAENQLRYGNYSDEMSRMAQAASMTPSLASAEYAGLTPLLQAAAAGTELPFAGINPYISGIGSLFQGTGTTTQKQGLGSTLAGLAGAGLSGWASGGFK